MCAPNILFIICHDLGRHLACYGRAPIASPNLDRLAAEGVLFTNHFCTAPSCSPSRAAISTGRHPHSNGCMGLVGSQGWELPASETTMPEHLAGAGYTTYLFGMQHERPDRTTLGYEYVPSGLQNGRSESVAEAVTDFLKAPPSTPFFLNVGLFEPHRPFRAGGVCQPNQAYMPSYLPDDSIVRQEMADFGELVRRMDAGVGTILEAVDAAGLRDNTLVVFTTDHGIDMPRAKGTLYDPGIESALLLRWPGHVQPGAVCDELLSNVDVLPTLLGIAGVGIPDSVQGRSFRRLLEGDTWDSHSAIFAEKTHHCHYDPMRCIRTRTHKYIFNFGILRAIEIPSDGEMDTLSSVPELHVTRRPIAELYDLVNDPLEQHNLAGRPGNAELEANLRARLRAFLAETDDPLLDGILPIPKYLG